MRATSTPLNDKPQQGSAHATAVDATTANKDAAVTTAAPAGQTQPADALRHRPHSTTTARSKKHIDVLRARDELARAEAATARTRLALLEAEEDSDMDSEMSKDGAVQTQ